MTARWIFPALGFQESWFGSTKADAGRVEMLWCSQQMSKRTTRFGVIQTTTFGSLSQSFSDYFPAAVNQVKLALILFVSIPTP